MKKIALFAVLLLAVALTAFTTADWIRYNNPEGKFNIMFPRQPQETEQAVETEAGTLTLKLIMYEAGKYKDDNAAYGVIYTDYPDTLVHSDFKEEILDSFFANSIRGAANNMKGTVISKKTISYKNYPGRSAKMSFMDGEGVMNMQMFLIGSRGYILEVVSEAKNDNNASIDKFFKSFELTPAAKK